MTSASATTAVLRVDGVPVAEYVWRPDLPATSSPRPYLHPVRTLAGTQVTELQPADHVHHLGAGVAVSDLSGTNFWGGRTYVSGQGPTWLDNHGTQRHVDFPERDESGFVETVDWLRPGGDPVARERRTVRARPVGSGVAGGGWALDVTFALTNLTGAAVAIRSSAGKGRPGAGYGGFFWRAPQESTDRRVFTPDAEGEAAVHGSQPRWLALSGRAASGRPWTLVFVQAHPAGDTLSVVDPWFVRVESYPGVGPALAWEQPLIIERAAARRVVTLVLDGRPGRDEVAELVREVR
jgi:hypothetical protein